tara:strand:- start:1422 stop:1871 length:450 start_codon:yes stop_codon:yes gene_type:complete
MKKKLIICLLFIVGCSYQPIYLNKNIKNFEFYKIETEGEKNINRQIINTIGFKENAIDDDLNNLSLNTYFVVEETSKNSKGQVQSYRSIITIDLKISKKEKVIIRKRFSEEFSYNNKENRFELIEYQNEIKENLLNKSIEEIILFLNIQ